MKILLLGSQHGNEYLGDKLYAHLQHHYPSLLPYMTFRIGNPKAHTQRVRFIESDLNRSYDSSENTYEARRARHIQNFIAKNDFSLILDLHTTTCVQPPCFIVSDTSESALEFVRASTIEKVVKMRHAIVHHSLVGVCPAAVCIEVANEDLGSDILDSISKDIERYVRKEIIQPLKEIYIVDDLLLKAEVPESDAKTLKNFIKSKAGYIPILTGENSYKKNTDYLGFKACKVYRGKV